MSIKKSSTPSLHENVDEKRPTSTTEEEVIDFGGELSLPPPPILTPEQEKKLWRKVDLRLMPILSLMYLFSYMDRGNIGNAKLQGLLTQLNLSSQQYNIAVTMYFIVSMMRMPPTSTVSIVETPTNRFPSNYPSPIVFSSAQPNGSLELLTLMGTIKTYPQLIGVRILLGVAEAGLFPGVVYYLTFWYPRHQLQLRIALFYSAASLAGAFSGLLAYAIHFMSGTAGLMGWSWIFILEGMATVLVGILASLVMFDFPATASFLTPEERSFIVRKKKYDNSSVGEEEHFSSRHFWAALTDWQIWLHILVYMSVVAPVYGITLFLPTIINNFGHSPAISQLLTVPPYVVATILVLVFANYSDKMKMRSPFILLGLTFILIGFSINISNAPHGVKYFGTFFVVSGAYASFPGIVAWLGNNLAGQYKRGIGMAVHIGIGNFSGAIAANLYRGQDAPRFILGHGLELMFVGIGFIVTPIIIVSYMRINKKRDEAQRLALERGEANKYTNKQLREMGDRAPDFRYTL
ncbi:hypothetical protein D9619_013264 [Psilocybe cf. subviscida]|uniref:Major facilitator superfamily (MFS) profile domain-containing protein n=1 Tax=Psilocybe cf. subviscida TaxID=2480587 RepID=A0A8H5BS65_9AGAR|nr:hypothetical protein D9619_013264 [Psilocybe cf. subviscida]